MANGTGPSYQIPDPTAVFRFDVTVGQGSNLVGVFTECTLPNVEWEVQEVKEGGRNNYVHQLPGRRKAARVTLKNGLTKQMSLMSWYSKLMGEDFKEAKQKVTITLRDVRHEPMIRWNLENAYPIKITWPALKTSDNTVAIESLELACETVTIEAQ